MTELKPCPFCGSEGSIVRIENHDLWRVECSNMLCPASHMTGWMSDTEEEAIEVWNRRVKNG